MPGIPYFSGIQQILSGRMTYSAHGIAPSVASITFPPQPIEQGTGTLVFVDDVSGEAITFPNCLLEDVSYRAAQNGFVGTARILDERWTWQNQLILGVYNIRDDNGQLKTASKKTPQQLAALLLQAMGVVNFSVANLPNSGNPEVVWEYANAAQELQKLCADRGCRVVRELSGRVVIWPLGVGGDLPNWPNLAPDVGYNPANKPNQLAIVCGPTEWQTTFTLTAVAEEQPGGKWVALDSVSYKPSRGWEQETPGQLTGIPETEHNSDGDPTDRDLALRSVWKAYRVDLSEEFTLTGIDGQTFTAEDFFPLSETILETVTERGQDIRKPAFVKGVHYAGSSDLSNTTENAVVRTSWSLDAENGIVLFNDPVVQFDGTDALPAELKLVCAHSVYSPTSGLPHRQVYYQNVPGSYPGGGTVTTKRDDINLRYQSSGSNEPDLREECFYELQAQLAGMQTNTTGSVTTAGIRGCVMDGAIQQIAWQCGGQTQMTTSVSRNTERDPYTPSYAVRQQTIASKRQEQEDIREARRENRRRYLRR
ncbi:hypothetical protein [Rubinisphaera brasiliensis]|uniref:Uncharacterized protein n=1 Tax=Rubinisphaera brasiliensis (strain ATCC 49424 / DSM 5305 / JCM 21570 / IAM 15109 / NBRC 103401 / IFAM 1448) TaxID=756272 RepID=F0SPG1_RUBBR|nr:hypothetical protein [Rubinisphaera brasiliensis]ADY57865.1 hypothetical protein Plabr_0236 [Rubinisphaera brasiliensis DSM 5305]